MNDATHERLRAAVRDVADFPKAGISFKDIMPLLSEAELFRLTIDAIAATVAGHDVTKLVAIDARGFIFAGAVADRLGMGFVPVRKKGKLPGATVTKGYDLEYGSNVIELQRESITPGERVWIIDDVLATGGTAAAAAELVQEVGGTLCGMTFLVELEFLDGRRKLPAGVPVVGILKY
jgi:adenine phosphoribosyltransferase